MSELAQAIEQIEMLQPKSTNGRVKIKYSGYHGRDFPDYPIMLESEDRQPIVMFGGARPFGSKQDKKRGDICTFHGSQYHHESDKNDRDYPGMVHTSRTWHTKNESAGNDAKLFVMLWNNRKELLRLAKVGLTVEASLSE